jgi:hypothetical protein
MAALAVAAHQSVRETREALRLQILLEHKLHKFTEI